MLSSSGYLIVTSLRRPVCGWLPCGAADSSVARFGSSAARRYWIGFPVVGFAGAGGDADNPILHAFLWTRRDGIQDLGTLPGDVTSEAHGINERGQVVGVSCDAAGNCRAFLWEDGVMTDLNTLVAPGYTGIITTAQDINAQGEITGRAFDPVTGERPAFLATLIP